MSDASGRFEEADDLPGDPAGFQDDTARNEIEPEPGPAQFHVSDSDEAEDPRTRFEVERRHREQSLDATRIKLVLMERRSVFRARTYFLVGGITALIAAIQLATYSARRLHRYEFSLRVIVYIAAVAGLSLVAFFCYRRVRRCSADLSRPMLDEPSVEPDFSTLSDGSQRLDTAAENLQRLYERDK